MIPLVISWSLIVLGWSLVFLVFYFTMGTTIKDRLIRLLYWVMVKIFFREITISHLERIPVDKPVMLVCAPHANQFVDAMVLSTHLQRKLFFIGAASSFTKYKVAGMFMRWMDSIIPVERQQDIKQVISGRASVQGNRVIVCLTRIVDSIGRKHSLYQRNTKEWLLTCKWRSISNSTDYE